MDLITMLKRQWDRVAAWVLIAVGLLALLLGYVGISGTPHVAEQLPYFISGGLLGVFVLGVAGMLWVSADVRDEWRELHAIRQALEEANARAVPLVQEPGPDHSEATPVVAARNGRRTRASTTRTGV
jgi:hypothetical protein